MSKSQTQKNDNTPKIEIVIKSFPKHDSIIQDIIKQNVRYNVLCSSRQFGKTSISTKLILYWLLHDPNQKALYVSPTYPLSRSQFKVIISGLSKEVISEANKSELYIKFINGSELYFKSATNDTGIRGGSYHYVVVDEFSFIPEDTWNSVIRPTMNVIGKQALLVSTPRGKNLFHTLFLRGEQNEKGYRCYRGHYLDNPLYNIQEVEDAKRVLPPNVYKQEYEGLFLDDFGSVFPNILDLSTLFKWPLLTKPGPYFGGLDLGRKSDYCVLTIMNSRGEVVEVFRENKSSWHLLIEKIIQVLRRYNARVGVEINGIGDPVFEQIHSKYHNSYEFLTTNDSKNQIIEELILEMSEKKLLLPSKELFPTLHFELDTFTFEYSKQSRKILYGAKSGFHDDTIISLALANHMRKTGLRSGMRWTKIN